MPMNENGLPFLRGLDEEQLLPALKWMSEQIPGGFFVYLADESQALIHVNRVCLRLFGCDTLEQFLIEEYRAATLRIKHRRCRGDHAGSPLHPH